MAGVCKKDIPEIASFMSDLWELVKHYWNPEDTDEYWNSFVMDARELSEKYNNDPYVNHMLAAFAEYIDKKHNDGQVGFIV